MKEGAREGAKRKREEGEKGRVERGRELRRGGELSESNSELVEAKQTYTYM